MSDTEPDPKPLDPIERLADQVEMLNTHRMMRVQNSFWRLGLFQFYRGLAFGLGSVLGATILVSVLGYFLSTIDFIPILGDWAAEIAKSIQKSD